MATILALFAAGIVIALHTSVTLWIWIAGTALSAVLAAVLIRSQFSTIAIALTTICAAALCTSLTTPKPIPLTGTAAVEICSQPTTYDNSTYRTEARIRQIGGYSTTQKVMLYTSKTYPLGTLLEGSIEIRPWAESQYSRLMTTRGFAGTARFVAEPSECGVRHGLRYFTETLRSGASKRLEKLGMSPDAQAVTEAMILGVRSGITPSMRESYSATGTAHLLAISGLHVGIVFMLINALLYLLPAVRYGHIIKNAVAVVLIWLFVTVSGSSPSAIRAAVMFSAVQIGFMTGNINVPLNTLCGAATLMLAVRPQMLGDISFQLSFAAVAGITLWFVMLMKPLESRSKPLNALWGMIIVSVASSIATFPLTAFYFGRVTPVGIILSPVVVLLANITVFAAMLWITMPFNFAAGVVGSFINFTASAQNRITDAVAALPLDIEWHPSQTTVAITYTLLIVATYIIQKRTAKVETSYFK